MMSRSALAQGARLRLRQPCRAHTCLRRRLASTAAAPEGEPTPGIYQTTEFTGIKTAFRNSSGPTTRLAVVAKAGIRHQPMPGLTVGLEESAFKSTEKRSTQRILRESELLGGRFGAYHTREALVIQASFLRKDMPYFTELLAEVISQSAYKSHEFHLEVEPVLQLKQEKYARDVRALALDAVHAAAFHTGLGYANYPTQASPLKPYLSEHSLASFADAAYVKPNIAVVADGASDASLHKWVEGFFRDVRTTSSSQLQPDAQPSKYYGGQQRIAHPHGNSVVIAFPGAALTAPKPEVAVLAALLGGRSSIKWTRGFSLLSKALESTPDADAVTANYAYSDAGLLAVQLSGAAPEVRNAAAAAVAALRSIADGGVSKDDLTRAIASAKFDLFANSELPGAGLVSAATSLLQGGKQVPLAEQAKAIDTVTSEKLKTTMKSLLDGKASVAAVGDPYVLPYAEELGLKV